MDSLELIVFIIVVVMVALLIKGMRNAKQSNTTEQATTQTTTTGPTTIVDGDKQQIVDDIKATQTSRVVDQVAILEDLGQTTQNYRQFCELTGTTQNSGGVTAPYSKRQVAYYDVRCYKIERVNGREIETLVAQERSFDRFYFTDPSCDTKVYVALDTFGKNVILVNSMNHIEGPTSDFSKAISNRTASISGTGAAKLMVADAARNLRTGLRDIWSWTVLAPTRIVMAAGEALRFTGMRMQPAYAAAFSSTWQWNAADAAASKGKAYFSDGPRKAPKPSGGGKPASQHPIGSSKPQHHSSQVSLGSSKPPQYSSQVTLGSGKIPSGLDTFLGLGGTGMGGLQQNPYLGGPMNPHYGGYGTGKPSGDLGTALLNIGLSALLASMNSSSSGTHTTHNAPHTQSPTYTTAPASSYTQTNNTFMGYRIVEDVVPLNYPVYCLGDLYKNGSEVYMGKAMGKVSQSYYFATKLETEVLEHLQK